EWGGGDGDLVVDPALVRVPHPGVEIFRGDDDVRRAFDAAEILQPPRIGFTDRHSAPRNAGWAKASRAHARDLARNARARAASLPLAHHVPLCPARPLLVHQKIDRKIFLRIGPQRRHAPAGTACERAERGGRVFVAVLGVDRLAGAELDGLAQDLHLLALGAGEVHLDPRALAVEEGMVLEPLEIETRAQLPA